jgi:hypothetical protein
MSSTSLEETKKNRKRKFWFLAIKGVLTSKNDVKTEGLGAGTAQINNTN